MMHRDSLGTVQRIEPGAINWMSAGEGIVHSERAPDDLRGSTYVNHGLQLWVSLPQAMEAGLPSFTHTPASAISACELPGASIKVLIGEALGLRSPVPAASPTLILDIRLAAGARVALPLQAEELGVYSVDEAITVQGQPVSARQLLALGGSDEPLIIEASSTSRVVIIGGQPLGPRFMWWNFVASSKAAIEAAALRWEQGGFRSVPGETEHIPLPSSGRPA
jgi:redox-sensitive bicupin YhaK (pirin superfamily)